MPRPKAFFRCGYRERSRGKEAFWLTQDLTDRIRNIDRPGRLWRCRPQAETIGSYFGILHAAKRPLSPTRCATSRIASLAHREGLDGRTPV